MNKIYIDIYIYGLVGVAVYSTAIPDTYIDDLMTEESFVNPRAEPFYHKQINIYNFTSFSQ